MQILSQVAEVVVEHPDGIVREVIFPRVKEEIFRNLVAEFHISGPRLRLLRQTIMQRKFVRSPIGTSNRLKRFGCCLAW